MIEALKDIDVGDHDPVSAEQIPFVLTAGNFVYDDGATQVIGDRASGDPLVGARPGCSTGATVSMGRDPDAMTNSSKGDSSMSPDPTVRERRSP